MIFKLRESHNSHHDWRDGELALHALQFYETLLILLSYKELKNHIKNILIVKFECNLRNNKYLAQLWLFDFSH